MLGFAGFHSWLSSYNLPNVKSQYDWIGFADIDSALGGGSGYGAYGGCTTVSRTPILTLTKTLILNVTLNMNLTLTDQDPDNPPYDEPNGGPDRDVFFLNSYENARGQRNNLSRVI